MRQIVLLMGLFGVSLVFPVFADNPTTHGEWNFVFEKYQIYQDPAEPTILVVQADIKSTGMIGKGSVDVMTFVTDPDGKTTTHFEQVSDILRDEPRLVVFEYLLESEGIYQIQTTMRTTSEAHQYHIFDEKKTSYEVFEDSFEKKLDVRGIDSDQGIEYHLSEIVPASKSIHIKLNLPDSHPFEKIQVENGEFKKEFGLKNKDLYLKSYNGYAQLQVDLVRETSILPMADAQMDVMEYLKFYSVDGMICVQVDCEPIDVVSTHTGNNRVDGKTTPTPTHEDEFPYWILSFVAILGIIPLMMRKKSKSNDPWGTPYEEF